MALSIFSDENFFYTNEGQRSSPKRKKIAKWYKFVAFINLLPKNSYYWPSLNEVLHKSLLENDFAGERYDSWVYSLKYLAGLGCWEFPNVN